MTEKRDLIKENTQNMIKLEQTEKLLKQKEDDVVCLKIDIREQV
jgi:hypothetical protein